MNIADEFSLYLICTLGFYTFKLFIILLTRGYQYLKVYQYYQHLKFAICIVTIKFHD